MWGMANRPFVVAVVAALALASVALLHMADQIRRLRQDVETLTLRQ